jgi:hypothetical protein
MEVLIRYSRPPLFGQHRGDDHAREFLPESASFTFIIIEVITEVLWSLHDPGLVFLRDVMGFQIGVSRFHM